MFYIFRMMLFGKKLFRPLHIKLKELREENSYISNTENDCSPSLHELAKYLNENHKPDHHILRDRAFCHDALLYWWNKEYDTILSGFRNAAGPNSPSGTHFQVKLSDDFITRANSRQLSKLSKYFSFQSFALSSVKDQKGRYAMISADEDRTKPLRTVKPRKKEQAL